MGRYYHRMLWPYALAAGGLMLLAATLVERCASGAAGAGPATGLTLPGLLGDSGDGFARVTGPRPFRFPADHGPHSAYRSEWWYFTGNLRDSSGREFGYQLAFFRSALPRGRGDTAARASPWRTGQSYMAHFALSDPEAGRFQAYERFSRAALGLAGAHSAPWTVWLEDWTAAAVPGGDTSLFPLRLRAAQGEAAVDLVLEQGKPLVLQGDAGFSRKGPGAGNASHYYSFTRMPTRGRIVTAAGPAEVRGESWMDREWGSSLLQPGLSGWEWFGLRLDDSTEYAFFRLRGAGAEAARADTAVFAYGLRVDAAGRARRLDPGGIRARVLGRWRSPRGRDYPVYWRLTLPADSLEMEIAPRLENQELDLSIPYWEGAVTVKARKRGRALRGEGYLELTGY